MVQSCCLTRDVISKQALLLLLLLKQAIINVPSLHCIMKNFTFSILLSIMANVFLNCARAVKVSCLAKQSDMLRTIRETYLDHRQPFIACSSESTYAYDKSVSVVSARTKKDPRTSRSRIDFQKPNYVYRTIWIILRE